MSSIRRGIDSGTRGPRWPRFLWAVAIAAGLVGLSTTTCGGDFSRLAACDDTDNCAELPGTVCVDELCTCTRPNEHWCDGDCWPDPECWLGPGSGPCDTAADCPQAGFPHCGQAVCKRGGCFLDSVPFSKISSQVRGDCQNLWCDGDGNLIAIEDGSDIYNDGVQCSTDTCEAGEPKNAPLSPGSTCLDTGEGVCSSGACVECIDKIKPCDGGLACDGTRCVEMHCVNDQWDEGLGETSDDCGGPCSPCAPGLPCKVPADCRHGVCQDNTCQSPTCSDGVRNDNETGTDCGGPPSCPRCPAGEGCKFGHDCESGVCWAGFCEEPTCSDAITNGDETGWDCGGSCTAPCP